MSQISENSRKNQTSLLAAARGPFAGTPEFTSVVARFEVRLFEEVDFSESAVFPWPEAQVQNYTPPGSRNRGVVSKCCLFPGEVGVFFSLISDLPIKPDGKS